MATTKSTRANRARLPRQRPGPPGGKRDLNRRAIQQKLTEAALELFLADGVEVTTIDQIVDRARIAKGSFYRYARDKSDLVAQIMQPVGDQVAGALDRCASALHRARRGTLVAIYVQLANELSNVVTQYPSRVLLYLQEKRSPPTSSRSSIQAIAEQLTSRAIALTEIARDRRLIRNVNPRISALVVVGAIDAMLFEHLRRPLSILEPHTMIAELVAIVVSGIGRSPASPDASDET